MEHRISFNFNARYETLGDFHEGVESLWVVCHGHGQLAKYFIQKFKGLDDGKTVVVAPEGLFRYYLQGFSGRVGATWMTKEDRLSDIDNYLCYLTAVLDEVKKKLPNDVKVTLFGFSQGAATISRFATQTDVNFEKLVLWAGIFPPDLPPLQSQRRLQNKKVYTVYGLQDPYLNEERIAEQESIAEQIKVTPERITFEGEHELYEKAILRISKDDYLQ
jgi:predicted esterase